MILWNLSFAPSVRWLSGKESAWPCRRCHRCGFNPWSRRSNGRGNGNPLQYSCLENPTDRVAWWTTIHGVAKSQTRLSNWAHDHWSFVFIESVTTLLMGKISNWYYKIYSTLPIVIQFVIVVQSSSCVQLLAPPLKYTRPHCPSPSPGVCPSSCPLNQWCHPTISPSVALFFFCLQSFSASGSFPMSQLFPPDDQSIRTSSS